MITNIASNLKTITGNNQQNYAKFKNPFCERKRSIQNDRNKANKTKFLVL